MASESAEPSMADVKRRVIAAICKLYRHDKQLLDVDANERSLTHKLAEYLQCEFSDWNVDCEYNRRGLDVKRLAINSWNLKADDTEAKTVFPDIIVHRRLTERNLIVLEVKKMSGCEDTKDAEKLRAFTETETYKYKYGLFLRIGSHLNSALEMYENGSSKTDWSPDLRAGLKELGYA